MAIVKAAARLILREHERYRFTGPALCLGVPDIYLTRAELGGAALASGTGSETSFVEPREFLGALGIADFTSLDIPGSALRPDVIHDLNQPLPATLIDRFHLVIDPGTTEHVFDVKTALSNVVRSLRSGGVVIHFVPIYSYNGGYFSINPNVLDDFYRLNGFTDVRAYIIMWDRFRPNAARTKCYVYGPVLHARHALTDGDQVRFVPHLLFFARKGTPQHVQVPIQTEHEHHHSVPTSSTMVRLARAVLPSGWLSLAGASLRRRRQHDLIRKESFWI